MEKSHVYGSLGQNSSSPTCWRLWGSSRQYMPPFQPALIALQVPQVSGTGLWKAFVYIVIDTLKWKSNSNWDNFSLKLGGKWAFFPQANGKPLALRYRRPWESTTKCTSARAESTQHRSGEHLEVLLALLCNSGAAAGNSLYLVMCLEMFFGTLLLVSIGWKW